jgi:hypothetical protein
MKRRKRTEIVVEREQILVIRKLDGSAPQSCPQCGDQSQMVSVDEAASIVCVAARAIYQQVESRQTHFTEMPDGKLLVCINSSLQSARSKKNE